MVLTTTRNYDEKTIKYVKYFNLILNYKYLGLKYMYTDAYQYMIWQNIDITGVVDNKSSIITQNIMLLTFKIEQNIPTSC